ncbi:hypothetical protein [Stieleria varia]|uniref:Cytochrome C n=1 Tax=Stieleria varia TaxID=2528005 RepID=A0A5C5ZYW2_9BACT|nr:hypothetical protein [Stieleria varia]TWT91493.1 hypothetical protein Pla52n_65840 [Stieleria varia]
MIRLTLILLATLTFGVASGDEPVKPQQTDTASEDSSDIPDASVWMKKKMEYSQAILQGLAMSDFEAIRANAARMNKLNQVESFVRRKHPEYRTQLHTFHRVTTEIARQAEKKNIEGAALAFNQLTVSCVQCHVAMRNIDDE